MPTGKLIAEPKRVRIIWEGPLTVDQVRQKNSDDDCGLYQIYAHHIVFGAKALVYIGRAIDQWFATRIHQHWGWWLQWEGDVSIRLGRLDPDCYRKDDEWKEWSELLGDR